MGRGTRSRNWQAANDRTDATTLVGKLGLNCRANKICGLRFAGLVWREADIATGLPDRYSGRWHL